MQLLAAAISGAISNLGFEIELMLVGVVDGLGLWAHAGEVAVAALFFVLAVGAHQRHAQLVGAVALQLGAG
ncbi:hypothetical protein MGAST_30125 [Mycobacterium gastri 'Wayne']|uniref:Uncharacterized protein n=1 Tax=Mycobacterium gastri TaxID=1777 RepID=A0A1X1VWX0_MYCGS|nr:hypothetical protein MGAST_30125 [Mycobacterium gastri 'Wayne']ORV73757.1 hypothetical protein AWC07_02080 [Mycobacterium gastri]